MDNNDINLDEFEEPISDDDTYQFHEDINADKPEFIEDIEEYTQEIADEELEAELELEEKAELNKKRKARRDLANKKDRARQKKLQEERKLEEEKARLAKAEQSSPEQDLLNKYLHSEEQKTDTYEAYKEAEKKVAEKSWSAEVNKRAEEKAASTSNSYSYDNVYKKSEEQSTYNTSSSTVVSEKQEKNISSPKSSEYHEEHSSSGYAEHQSYNQPTYNGNRERSYTTTVYSDKQEKDISAPDYHEEHSYHTEQQYDKPVNQPVYEGYKEAERKVAEKSWTSDVNKKADEVSSSGSYSHNNVYKVPSEQSSSGYSNPTVFSEKQEKNIGPESHHQPASELSKTNPYNSQEQHSSIAERQAEIEKKDYTRNYVYEKQEQQANYFNQNKERAQKEFDEKVEDFRKSSQYEKDLKAAQDKTKNTSWTSDVEKAENNKSVGSTYAGSKVYKIEGDNSSYKSTSTESYSSISHMKDRMSHIRNENGVAQGSRMPNRQEETVSISSDNKFIPTTENTEDKKVQIESIIAKAEQREVDEKPKSMSERQAEIEKKDYTRNFLMEKQEQIVDAYNKSHEFTKPGEGSSRATSTNNYGVINKGNSAIILNNIANSSELPKSKIYKARLTKTGEYKRYFNRNINIHLTPKKNISQKRYSITNRLSIKIEREPFKDPYSVRTISYHNRNLSLAKKQELNKRYKITYHGKPNDKPNKKQSREYRKMKSPPIHFKNFDEFLEQKMKFTDSVGMRFATGIGNLTLRNILDDVLTDEERMGLSKFRKIYNNISNISNFVLTSNLRRQVSSERISNIMNNIKVGSRNVQRFAQGKSVYKKMADHKAFNMRQYKKMTAPYKDLMKKSNAAIEKEIASLKALTSLTDKQKKRLGDLLKVSELKNRGKTLEKLKKSKRGLLSTTVGGLMNMVSESDDSALSTLSSAYNIGSSNITQAITSRIGKQTVKLTKGAVNLTAKGVRGVGRITGLDKVASNASQAVYKRFDNIYRKTLENNARITKAISNKVPTKVKKAYKSVRVTYKRTNAAFAKAHKKLQNISTSLKNSRLGKALSSVKQHFHNLGVLGAKLKAIILGALGFLIITLVLITIMGFCITSLVMEDDQENMKKYVKTVNNTTTAFLDEIDSFDYNQSSQWNELNTRMMSLSSFGFLYNQIYGEDSYEVSFYYPEAGRRILVDDNTTFFDTMLDRNIKINVVYKDSKGNEVPWNSSSLPQSYYDNGKELISMMVVYFQNSLDNYEKSTLCDYLEKLGDDTHRIEYQRCPVFKEYPDINGLDTYHYQEKFDDIHAFLNYVDSDDFRFEYCNNTSGDLLPDENGKWSYSDEYWNAFADELTYMVDPTGNNSVADNMVVPALQKGCYSYQYRGNRSQDKCCGHLWLKITISVDHFDDTFRNDSQVDSDLNGLGEEWTGWDQGNIEWVKAIYEPDWLELYDGAADLYQPNYPGDNE